MVKVRVCVCTFKKIQKIEFKFSMWKRLMCTWGAI